MVVESLWWEKNRYIYGGSLLLGLGGGTLVDKTGEVTEFDNSIRKLLKQFFTQHPFCGFAVFIVADNVSGLCLFSSSTSSSPR